MITLISDDLLSIHIIGLFQFGDLFSCRLVAESLIIGIVFKELDGGETEFLLVFKLVVEIVL